jgi:hypothetical protein
MNIGETITDFLKQFILGSHICLHWASRVIVFMIPSNKEDVFPVSGAPGEKHWITHEVGNADISSQN